MNTCDICKYWRGEAGGTKLPFQDPCGKPHYEMYGWCSNPRTHTGYHVNSKESQTELPIDLAGCAGNGLYSEPSLDEGFYCGPKFGCIHWEAK